VRRWETVDLSIYARGFAVLARNPVVFVFPLVAAAIGIGLSFLRGPLFDPLGGYDFGLLGLLVSLINGFAFGLALLAAETAWRGNRISFAAVWNEGKRKAGNILLAIVGFVFVLYIAGLIGGFLGLVGLLVPAVAVFFLIYTIPGAAIGGIPGSAALAASIDRVRQNYLAAAVLVIVSLLLYYYVGVFLGPYISNAVGVLAPYATAIIQALVIAYLAVVTARQYDEVAFFRRY
jgi:hypothetical protein